MLMHHAQPCLVALGRLYRIDPVLGLPFANADLVVRSHFRGHEFRQFGENEIYEPLETASRISVTNEPCGRPLIAQPQPWIFGFPHSSLQTRHSVSVRGSLRKFT